jgi:hypothetical protein
MTHPAKCQAVFGWKTFPKGRPYPPKDFVLPPRPEDDLTPAWHTVKLSGASPPPLVSRSRAVQRVFSPVGQAINYREVYICFNPIEADVVKNMLKQHGVTCLLRDMRMGPYPLTVGKFSEIRIAVDDRYLRKALKTIRQARADGYLSEEGQFKDDIPRSV